MEALLQASWPQGAYSASWCQDKVELDIWHVQYGLGVPWGVQPHHGHEGHQSLRLWTWGEWLGTCKRTAGHSAGTCVRSLTLLCKADFKFSDFQGCNRILLSEERMPTVIGHPHHGRNRQGSCYQHCQQQILPIHYCSPHSIGKCTLNRYYGKTDLLETYCIAMRGTFQPLSHICTHINLLALDPQYKLEYMWEATWPQTWIDTAKELVCKNFEAQYKGEQPNNNIWYCFTLFVVILYWPSSYVLVCFISNSAYHSQTQEPLWLPQESVFWGKQELGSYWHPLLCCATSTHRQSSEMVDGA